MSDFRFTQGSIVDRHLVDPSIEVFGDLCPADLEIPSLHVGSGRSARCNLLAVQINGPDRAIIGGHSMVPNVRSHGRTGRSRQIVGPPIIVERCVSIQAEGVDLILRPVNAPSDEASVVQRPRLEPKAYGVTAVAQWQVFDRARTCAQQRGPVELHRTADLAIGRPDGVARFDERSACYCILPEIVHRIEGPSADQSLRRVTEPQTHPAHGNQVWIRRSCRYCQVARRCLNIGHSKTN